VLEGDVRRTLDEAFSLIIEQNLAWPAVYVHRDYMPRNLMVGDAASTLGVLDFQDAVYGPVTYDIASLMRDAFLSWDEDFVLDITVRYWQKAKAAGLPVGHDFGEFYRGVEWMGLQRHLKVAGIFARLTLRDGKPRYLADTPRFIAYIRSTCNRYRELKPLLRLVEKVEGIEVPNVFAFGRS
jgi:aminoglycoside/choline kinase family phosphotransferase